MRTSGELGEITLTISPVRIISVAANAPRPTDPAQNQLAVHERAKKAHSHCVAFGNEVALPLSPTLRTQRIGATPLATFVFKYRPLERLIADGIAPPPPPLPPHPNKRPCSDTENDRAGAEALRQVQVLTERVVQLEAELKGASKRVKTEATDEITNLTGYIAAYNPCKSHCFLDYGYGHTSCGGELDNGTKAVVAIPPKEWTAPPRRAAILLSVDVSD
ncbi:hypothetical protein BJ138DRAFT_1128994 [Hygrophoropsis aurantiaca]|uniref:Uncharacterized protein n=1 Tax=Hygrophoropsis aurantiaca TaxID=72124 RepID=A0ACB8A2N8_9AGAM|nr:hypothetical protein BJ138DRAFT_1128994 [Hygrophoropsis aurantiaca]